MNAGFALMIETACCDFESLQRIVTGEVEIKSAEKINSLRAAGAIRMALAKSFVFNLNRARRILEQEADTLPEIPRKTRKAFINLTKNFLLLVRDVNEHGFEKKSNKKPTFYEQQNGQLDETSLVIHDEKTILMGPINLADYYPIADELRRLAGFAALSNESRSFGVS